MLTKVCTICEVEKSVDEYSNYTKGKYGVKADCKTCNAAACRQYYKANKEAIAEQRSVYQKANLHIYSSNTAKRRASKKNATPAWADLEAIKGMYQLAAVFNRTGMNLQVDHIVPLQGKMVCGLHCEANLQLMPASDNISKGNRHWPDMAQT
jgi:hypothetical protein